MLEGAVSGMDESYWNPLLTSVSRVEASDSRYGALQQQRAEGAAAVESAAA